MVQYVGAERVMYDEFVKTRIATVASALNTISTGLADRVYLDFAPKSTTWPAIIYQSQDDPRDIRGIGSATVMVDGLYLVKAVAQVGDYHLLAPIMKTLHEALTTTTTTSVGDGQVLSSVRERTFSLTEQDEGVVWRHLGGFYQIYGQG